TFAFDAAGRETSTTDRDGRRIDFSYDELNRKTGETWVAADGQTVLDTRGYTYDANGNILTAVNGSGGYTLPYDRPNRPQTEQEPFGLALTFSFDALNHRTQVQDSFGTVLTSVYNADPLHRLTSRQLGGTGQTPLRIDEVYTARDQLNWLYRYS